MTTTLDDKFESLESVLTEHLPKDVLAKVFLSIHGPGAVLVDHFCFHLN